MIHLLDASSPTDAAAWLALVERLPPAARDLHYLPGYVRVYGERRGGKALCAVYEGVSGFAIYPFVDLGEEIACAYGYGGPLASEGFESAPEFAVEFAAAMRERGVKREFCRLHPLLSDWQRPLVMLANLVPEKPVVSIDLSQDIDAGMRKGHVSAAAKAVRSNVTIQISDADFSLLEFAQIYAASMERKNADPRWHLDLAFLRDLTDTVPSWAVASAYVGSELECSCLLLYGYGVCYYQYAASYDRHRDLGAGTLLVAEAARWAKRKGMRQFYLGGGLTAAADDPLLRFKQGFTRDRLMLYKYERGF